MNDPWTWTTVWGLTVRAGWDGQRRAKGGGIGTTVRMAIKKKKGNDLRIAKSIVMGVIHVNT